MNEETKTNPTEETAPLASTQAEDTAKKKLRRAEKGVRDYQRILLRLVALLLVVWLLFLQVIGLTRMPNTDMYPRIDAGDLVLFYRLDKDVQAQDVIVIEKLIPGTREKRLYICRVIATAGDTVEITDLGELKINGDRQIESNIFSQTTVYDGYTEYPLTLEEGQCFVLADRRSGGADSRWFGAVEQREILGTVIAIVRRNNL